MTYSLTTEQKTTLSTLVDNGDYSAGYQYLYDILSVPDGAGQIDQGVRGWLGSAAQINADSGSFLSEYVRNVTQTNGALEGHPISNEMFQNASNELAQNVLSKIVLNNGEIPSAGQIIADDVSNAVRLLGLQPQDWAGTLTSWYFFDKNVIADYIFTNANPLGENIIDLLTQANIELLSGITAFLGIPSIPDWIPGVGTGWANYKNSPPPQDGSPLILDLGTTGITLSALNGPGSVYWDIDRDGFVEASAWVGPEDGLLCIDLNNDGAINDHGELFGDQTGFTNGFLALGVYDSNHDGHITSSDAQFTDLKVWVDADSDAISETSELRTLSALGITEINLNYTGYNQIISGNNVPWASTFTINGQTRQVVDAFFNYDDLNSEFAANDNGVERYTVRRSKMAA